MILLLAPVWNGSLTWYFPQLFPRVSTQEARVALSTLQRAFTEAERIIPGVTTELIHEIVDSVERTEIDDDRR
jgi:hypothetical protein